MSSPTPAAPPSPVFDLLAVGYGPASVALAIALSEHNSGAPTPAPPVYSSLGGLREALGFDETRQAREADSSARSTTPRRAVKACFLEKHDRFRWHPGMMIEGSTMQISFLKDLATLRNPQSGYTFLAYLASFNPSRLVSFISLSTFTPSRREFADYLQWCAEKAQREMQEQGGDVCYGEEVVAVDALREEEKPEGEADDVRILKVTSRRVETGEIVERYARNIVVSTGGQPRLPPQLSAPDVLSSGRVLHTASFVEQIHTILSSIVSSPSVTSRPIRLAVVGAGQSAAECFLAIRNRLASILPANLEHRPQIDMLFRSSSLRPTDEGAFSNEVFDPAMSQAMFRLPEEHRLRVLAEAKGTNYSIVNPVKLEELYQTMYAQKVDEDISARSPSSASDLVHDPKLNIKPFSALVSGDFDSSSSTVTLTIHNSVLSETREVEYDVVVCGTGYDRQAWRHILFPSSSPSSAVSTSSLPSVPLGQLLPDVREGSLSESPSLSSPPALELPETAFASSSRRAFADSPTFSPSSRSPSSARDTSSSRRSASPTTAASSPPSPGSPTSKSGGDTREGEHDYQVAENYRLLLPERTKTGRAFRPTVWLQGSCEKTHGISDSLLSVLAVRSGEVVQSILREAYFGEETVV
ncbi:hypothetical protein JCM8547_000790 [Rhodosporidiobolus lusitaniae]